MVDIKIHKNCSYGILAFYKSIVLILVIISDSFKLYFLLCQFTHSSLNRSFLLLFQNPIPDFQSIQSTDQMNRFTIILSLELFYIFFNTSLQFLVFTVMPHQKSIIAQFKLLLRKRHINNRLYLLSLI